MWHDLTDGEHFISQQCLSSTLPYARQMVMYLGAYREQSILLWSLFSVRLPASLSSQISAHELSDANQIFDGDELVSSVYFCHTGRQV